MSRADRIREAFTGGRGPGWRATDAYARAVLLGVGLVVLGALLHKVELVLFGAPFLVSALFALGTEVAGEPSVSVRPLPRTAEPGEATTGVEVDPAVGTELLAVRLPVPGTPGELGPIHLLPATSAPIVVKLRREAWGDGVDLRADHLFAGPDALLVHGPVVGVERGRVVLPPVDALPAGLLPARAAGLVGVHRTRRPGDSTELRDIRAFQPGDRLRRIDWRVSLRSPTLHVREHHAEADADVVLALDTRLDLGRAVADWSTGHPGGTSRPGGSLDTAVRAAASLAAGYLHQGDRVALADLGRPQLGVRPGACGPASGGGSCSGCATSSSCAPGRRAGRRVRCSTPTRFPTAPSWSCCPRSWTTTSCRSPSRRPAAAASCWPWTCCPPTSAPTPSRRGAGERCGSSGSNSAPGSRR